MSEEDVLQISLAIPPIGSLRITFDRLSTSSKLLPMSKTILPTVTGSDDEAILHTMRCCSAVEAPSWPSGDRRATSAEASIYDRDTNIDALLNYSATHHCSFDTGLPGPRVVQHASNCTRYWDSSERRYEHAMPPAAPLPRGRDSSMDPISPLELYRPDSEEIGDSAIPKRVQIEPQTHLGQQHAEVHSPKVSERDDFDMARDAQVPDQVTGSSRRTSYILLDGNQISEEATPDPLTGRVFRTLTGGDICEELVDISAHKHDGHPASVKVRPTIGVSYFAAAAHDSHQHIAKVRSLVDIPEFKYANEDRNSTEQHLKRTRRVLDAASQGTEDGNRWNVDGRRPPPSSPSLQPSVHERLYERDLDRPQGHGQMHSGHNTILKIRPADDLDVSDSTEVDYQSHAKTYKVRDPEAISQLPFRYSETGLRFDSTQDAADCAPHGGHIRIPKVLESFMDPFRTARKDEQTISSMPKITDSAQIRPSREAHIGHASIAKVQPTEGDPRDRGTGESQKRHRGCSLDGRKSRIRSDVTQLSTDLEAATGSTVQGSSYWGFLPISPRIDSGKQTHQTEDLCNDKKRATWAPSVEYDAKPARESRSSLSERIDTKKATQWLRELLRIPEPYSTKLTMMPERPQHTANVQASHRSGEGAEDIKKHSVASRILTRQSTATASIDTKFRKTMSNLEQLLNEACVLANHLAEQEEHQCGPEHDVCMPTRHAGAYPPSVHESLPDEDSDIDEHGKIENTGREVSNGPTRNHDVVNALPADPKPTPKHHRSAPMLHSRKGADVSVPPRQSSLAKNSVYSSNGILVVSKRESVDEDGCLFVPSHFHKGKRKPGAHIPGPEHKDAGTVHPNTVVPKKKSSVGHIRLFHKPCVALRVSYSPLELPIRQPKVNPLKNKFSNKSLASKRSAAELSTPRKRDANWSYDGVPSDDVIDFTTQYNLLNTGDGTRGSDVVRAPRSLTSPSAPQDKIPPSERDANTAASGQIQGGISLRGRSHVSLRGYQGFSLARSHKRKPVARDWSDVRKRFAASVACISTALIGVLIGIYAGLVPSIQYWIADLNHYAILGNVFFYLGMAIPSFFFWPLPLLHGRKPYILSSLAIAMPLLFPQAIAVSVQRSPYSSAWR